MNILIVRNATFHKNASFNRIIDALHENNDLTVLSRNREKSESPVETEMFEHKNKKIENIIVNVNSEMGSGVKNIGSLILYQIKIMTVMIRKRKKIDTVHSFDLDTGLISLLYSKIFRKKLVYHIADFYADSRGGIPPLLGKILRKIEYLIINSANATIICTKEREEQIEGSRPKQLEIIHNAPVFPEDFLKTEIMKDSQREKIRITYIGTLAKNRFIKEVTNFVKENKQYELYIGGLGVLEEWLKETVKDIDNISYLGRVDYKDTFTYYAKSDIMIAMYDPNTKNHKYSAPNKIYEAMALGKPIIVARDSGVDQVVIDNNMGYVVDYGVESFIELMNYIQSNKEELNSKSQNSADAYKNYSWTKMSRKLNDLYKKI